MMPYEECVDIIRYETMSPKGFLFRIRENVVDDTGIRRLTKAIAALREHTANHLEIRRDLLAWLFEAPWEIENTVEHYRAQDRDLGKRVSGYADQLREAIHALLWDGLDLPINEN